LPPLPGKRGQAPLPDLPEALPGKRGQAPLPDLPEAWAVQKFFPAREVVIFGGKGGVGKTTAAAAFALALAHANPKQKLLIFSTDPAHSLSDSLDEEIGELKSGVAGNKNLDAMEIDPGKWFEELKRRYRSWTDDLFASLSGGSRMEIKFDREAMRELVELTPPGIDEIAALGTISDLLDSKRYHTIILDTAPTGHLIRFLELPQVALSWIRTFMKLLLKYQNVLRANEVAEELVALSKSIKKVLALLTDSERCEFVGVAIPERMSLDETRDLDSFHRWISCHHAAFSFEQRTIRRHFYRSHCGGRWDCDGIRLAFHIRGQRRQACRIRGQNAEDLREERRRNSRGRVDQRRR